MATTQTTGTSEGGADQDGPVEPENLVLAGEFAATSRDQWLDAVDQIVHKSGRIREDALLGAGVQKLSRTSPDGIRVAPLYAAEDVEDLPETGVPGAWPFTRGARAAGHVAEGWDIRQRHAGTDPAAVKDAVMGDLENGVNSVWLTAGDAGVPVDTIGSVLADVYLDLAPVVLDAGEQATEAAEAYLALAAERGIEDSALLGTLGLDPIGLRARAGNGPDVDSVVAIAQRVANDFPLVKAVVVDATPVQETGGADAQELGFSLASGVAYLRALTAAGLDVAAAANLLEFRYAATPEQFPTIAKLRAARRLWARVLEASGTTDVAQTQHAVVPPTLFSRRDPWVNMLRGTVAGFAAGVG
ncbi:MAG: methylmalonyl-CoA mutase family protein, partial [Pseudonocardia sediminis]